jgi:hypothetical protein
MTEQMCRSLPFGNHEHPPFSFRAFNPMSFNGCKTKSEIPPTESEAFSAVQVLLVAEAWTTGRHQCKRQFGFEKSSQPRQTGFAEEHFQLTQPGEKGCWAEQALKQLNTQLKQWLRYVNSVA